MTPTVQPAQRLHKRLSWMQPQRDSFLPSPDPSSLGENDKPAALTSAAVSPPTVRTLSHSVSTKLKKPQLRQASSGSVASKSSTLMDASSPRIESASSSPRQRLSDESPGSSGPSLKGFRKKSGLSSLMNSLVGSPRRPAISAPENPVHVTHVGFNYDTGEFTVSVCIRLQS